MAAKDLNAIAQQAGLDQTKKKQIDGLVKLVDSHQKLMALPADAANQQFESKTQAEKNAHVAMFGGDNPLGNALHYLGNAVKTTIATPFKVLNEVSDFMTRVYRTGAIAIDQGVDLGKAFEIANDKGDNVFSPDRIQAANQKFGTDMMSVATQVASGKSLDYIMANGSEAEKQIASTAAQLKDKDHLFQDALDAAQAAKYSPGRQLANLLLPESMEGSGVLYKGISGVVDAGYRVFADPTLALGKAKKAYDAGNWMLYNVLGKEKFSYGRSLIGTVNNEARVDRVFANKQVVNFFDTYGSDLDKLAKARAAGNKEAAVEASTRLTRLAPEFGPAAQDEFIRAGVKDAATASNYLKNVDDTSFIFRGQATRKTPLVPQLDLARKTRVNFLTTGDKILNINKVGQSLVDDLYGLNATTEDIATALATRSEEIGKAEKSLTKFKQDGGFRFTNQQVRARVDRFAQKFAIVPFFRNNFFDVNEPDAAKKIYQLSRLGNSRYHSKIIQEAFQAGDEGQKKQIFEGLFNTVAEVKGWNKSEAGKKILAESAGRVEQYSPTITRDIIDELGNVKTERFSPSSFDGQQMAVLDWQLSSGTRVPSIYELSSLVAKDALTARMFGPNYKKWADKVTSWWVFGTLAGPRFIIRNSAEDLLVHALVGESQLGVLSGRSFMKRLASETAENKGGFISRLVDRANRNAAVKEIDNAIATGNKAVVDKVMQNAIIKDLMGGRIDEAAAKRMAEHFEFGNKEVFFDGVSEGAKNSLRGSSQYMNVTQDVSKYGTDFQALEFNGQVYEQANGSSFGDLNPVATQENRVSWLFTITANANSDLGAVAIRYMDPSISREKAIANIRAYLKGLPAKDKGRFKLYNVADEQRHAEAIYDTVRPYFSKRNGDLNTDLLSKVRHVDEKGNIKVNAKELSLEDIPGKGAYDDAPEFISGPTFVPVVKGNFTAGVIDKGWDWMGAANARLTRHPLAVDALNQTLKAMDESGFRSSYIANATKGLSGEELVAAEKVAKKQLAGMAEDLALNKVLAFVDNPEVRTQLAMNVRNFARFYRATEDFYRRVVRAVRYNPEALTRASLTYEGIAHSGWVQTDENGDQYFFYPGLSPVYRVMDKVAKVFGINGGFQSGIPVNFGAKLKMITPSMNPDSLFPTFAGPLAALPIKMIGNIVPQVKDLEQYLLGNYGQDQPMISAVLPAHLNRLLQTLNTDERNSQYASAARKAATYLEASGHGIDVKIDPNTGQEIAPSAGEIADYQDKLQGATMTVLALRFMFGFLAPASPSVTLKSDMAKWVRDNGNISYKATFNNMIKQYKGDIDKAVGEWIKYYPDQMPYTISESDSNVVANVRAVDKATQWITENQDLLKKYPEAASFLIPQAGNFNFDAYKLLFKSGLKTNKTVTDFVRQVSVAKDRETYYQKKDEFDQMLIGAVTTEEKRRIRNDWQLWSSEFKGVRPLLQEELGKGAASAVQRTRAIDDLRNMLSDSSVKTEPKVRGILQDMLDGYDNYIATRDLANTPGNKTTQLQKETLRVSAMEYIRSLAEGDANAMAAYNSLFAPLFR